MTQERRERVVANACADQTATSA